jgi:hypothetical protein
MPSLLSAETFCFGVPLYCSIQLNGRRALEEVAVGLSPIATRAPPVDVYAPGAQSEIQYVCDPNPAVETAAPPDVLTVPLRYAS